MYIVRWVIVNLGVWRSWRSDEQFRSHTERSPLCSNYPGQCWEGEYVDRLPDKSGSHRKLWSHVTHLGCSDTEARLFGDRLSCTWALKGTTQSDFRDPRTSGSPGRLLALPDSDLTDTRWHLSHIWATGRPCWMSEGKEAPSQWGRCVLRTWRAAGTATASLGMRVSLGCVQPVDLAKIIYWLILRNCRRFLQSFMSTKVSLEMLWFLRFFILILTVCGIRFSHWPVTLLEDGGSLSSLLSM